MATSSEQNSDLVEQFVAVTGATRHVAISLLEACAGNLDMAVGMHMDGGMAEAPAGPSSTGNDAATASSAAASTERPIIRDAEEEEVRAPIPQRTEVLVEDDSSKLAAWRMRRPRRATRSVFDGFRDFQAEARLQEDSLRGKAASKKRNLEDLFRPPVDITHKGTFQTARDIGSSQNRWLLVNVQNVQEFPCQTLNRDVWSCQEVRDVIRDNFIFWQVYNDSEEGMRFMQFYKVNQWPHVAIIDPFTGENQIVWQKISDGAVFCELAREFLAMQQVPDTSQGSSPAKRSKREPSIVDASEQDQMDAAIKASLKLSQQASSSPQYIRDSDSEVDLIEDSADEEEETFSDSDVDEVVPSNSQSPKKSSASSAENGQVAKRKFSPSSQRSGSSFSPSSSSSLSSYSRTIAFGDKRHNNGKSPRKDVFSRCKNLSARISTPCSYSPQSFASEEASSSSSNGSGSNVWLPPGGGGTANSSSSSSLLHPSATSPLRVDVDGDDSMDASCDSGAGLFTSSSSSSRHPRTADSDLPSTSRDPESCEKEDDRSADPLDWKEFWGDGSDPVSKIILRLPDNRRKQVELPCSSNLKALTVYCSSLGFPPEKYELVTNFPRRKLSEMSEMKTLKEAGLHPQDTVFVQDL